MQTVFTLLIIGAVILVSIGALRWVSSLRAATTQSKTMIAAFVPDPNNNNTLHVRGWNRNELDRILADFMRQYELQASSNMNVAANSESTLTITFPNDIEPRLLFYLVNYITYPKDFDLTHRSIGVLGRAILTPAFGPPNAALIGKRAQIYVPAQDTEYDLVYAKVETGAVYKIPFTNLIWKTVTDSRIPAATSGL